MTDEEYEYEIAEAAPTDSEGHPIHPERGHRICGATKSDRSTPAPHGRSRDDYAYCLLAAGWGTDSDVGACKNHPYRGSQIGESNPSYEHGGYARYFNEDDYTEDEKRRAQNLYEDLEDPESRDQFFRSHIGELLTRYGRTYDVRFARELRQAAAEFGYTPEEAKELLVEHSGSVDVNHDVPDHVAEAIIGAAESNLEGGGDG